MPEERTPLQDGQRRALRDLASASADVLRHAEQIRAEMCQIMRQTQDGQNLSTPNHQTPGDLRDAVVKRQAAATMCMALDLPADDVIKASRGEGW